MIDAENDGGESPRGFQLAGQALYVLPFYSLLSADRQAKVCICLSASFFLLVPAAELIVFSSFSHSVIP